MEVDTYDYGKVESVRNPDGHWINTSCFREPAKHFEKYGHYCAEAFGTPDWKDYWYEERRRCIFGHSVGGAKITGNHYAYLNYTPIMKVPPEALHSKIKRKNVKKVLGFPDFWDGDYNYFWVREIAREGILGALGHNLIEQNKILLPYEYENEDKVHIKSKDSAKYKMLVEYLNT